jgi:hypothetical protein
MKANILILAILATACAPEAPPVPMEQPFVQTYPFEGKEGQFVSGDKLLTKCRESWADPILNSYIIGVTDAMMAAEVFSLPCLGDASRSQDIVRNVCLQLEAEEDLYLSGATLVARYVIDNSVCVSK